jgi:tetratricopeptide (TPR) repeat protein
MLTARFPQKTRLHLAPVTAIAIAVASCVAPPAFPQTAQRARAANAGLTAARSLAASRQFPEAIAAYQKLLGTQPTNETAQLELAACYRQVHNEDEARRILQRARREHPRSAAAGKALGNFELEAQSFDAAIAALKAALALAPGDLEARNYLASAYQSKGDTARAHAQLDFVLARDPQNQLARYLRAQILADAGQDQPALADAESVVAARPDYLPGRVLLAKILVRLKQCSRAAETLRPTANAAPLDTQELFLLANAYDCSGRPELAKSVRDEFAEASRADRTRAENETQSKHLTERANDLARQNLFPQALELLQQALDKDAKNGFAYSQQAKIFFSMHDAARARQAIDQALALQPFQPDFLYVAGIIAESDSRIQEALASFEKVTQINPKEADAYFEIGKIHLQQGDRRAALAAFRHAATLDPSEPGYRRAADSLATEPKTH